MGTLSMPALLAPAVGSVSPVFGKDVDNSPPLTPQDISNSFPFEKCNSQPVVTIETVTKTDESIISGQIVSVTDISISKEAVCAMGFPEILVQMAIDVQFLDHGTHFANAVQLFKAAEDLCQHPEKQAMVVKRLYQAKQAKGEEPDKQHAEVTNQAQNKNACNVIESSSSAPKKAELQEKVKKLAQENYKLRQRKMCQACKKVELATSGVTFLPCGHFITCETCSELFDDCPACGKSIMGTVRTFLS